MTGDWLRMVLPGFDGFAWPWWLLALPAPWLLRWLMPPERSRGAALKVPFGARLRSIAAGSGGALGAGGPGPLAWLAWALLCVAAARPLLLGEPVQPPQAGRDMMIALDLSGSMSEPDMELGGRIVDRLTAAKAVIADFLGRRQGDRVGLLVFGERAYALAPLTSDLQTVREQLADSVVGLAGQATAVGDAVGLAVKRLREPPAGTPGPDQHVLILLTDGVNTAGALEPLKAAELARANGVRVHTIAFGGNGAMSLFGFRLPATGAAEQIDEQTLRRIATMTGGRFFRARDTAELAGIYAEIDRLEPIEHAGQAVRPRVEMYAWPLGLAMLLAALAWGWRQWPVRLRRTA